MTTFKYLVDGDATDNNTQPASTCQPWAPNSSLSEVHCGRRSVICPARPTQLHGPYNPTDRLQSLVPNSSPIVTSGDQADFANGGTLNLPPGKYLISFVADGHKIDGAHFTTDNGSTKKTVDARRGTPFDLPFSPTVRVQVFNDNALTNGQ